MKTLNSAIPAKAVAVNYTPEMVQVLRDAAPLDYEKAKILATQLNKNVRSIIAKAKREEIEYIAKEAPAKKEREHPTKAQMVLTIEAALDSKLTGLEKAPVTVLKNIITAIAKMANDSQTTVTES